MTNGSLNHKKTGHFRAYFIIRFLFPLFSDRNGIRSREYLTLICKIFLFPLWEITLYSEGNASQGAGTQVRMHA